VDIGIHTRLEKYLLLDENLKQNISIYYQGAIPENRRNLEIAAKRNPLFRALRLYTGE